MTTTTTTTTTTSASTTSVSGGASRRLVAAALGERNKARESRTRNFNHFTAVTPAEYSDSGEDSEDDLYECEICQFRGTFEAAIACEIAHATERPPSTKPTTFAVHPSTDKDFKPYELRKAWSIWRHTAQCSHEEDLRQQAIDRMVAMRHRALSQALEQALVEKREERQLSQGNATWVRQQHALARQMMIPEWAGAVAAAQSRQKLNPRHSHEHPSKFFFANSAKMNNERGAKCQGQGKRHQNAAVHSAPKAGAGRCAKWSSVKKKKSKTKR